MWFFLELKNKFKLWFNNIMLYWVTILTSEVIIQITNQRQAYKILNIEQPLRDKLNYLQVLNNHSETSLQNI